MKVLMVVPSFMPAWHLGGVVESQGLLSRGLAARGAQVDVLTTDSGYTTRLKVSTGEWQEWNKVRIRYCRTYGPLNYYFSPDVYYTCKANMRYYDMVHVVAFWTFPGLAACRIARAQGIPYTVAPHGVLIADCLKRGYIKKKIYMKVCEQGNMRGAAAVRYTSESERLSSERYTKDMPYFVVPNGIDIEEYGDLPSREETRRKWKVGADEYVICFLGRLHERKALDVLVVGFSEWKKQEPRARLIIAGPDDGMRLALDRLAAKLGVTEYVRFPGQLDKVKRRELYGIADVNVLTSYPGDNFGMAIVEGMAAGVPALVSEHVGIRADIEADKAGISVAVSSEAIREGLVRMFSEPMKMIEMKECAKRCAKSRYGLETVSDMMIKAFQDIIDRRRNEKPVRSAIKHGE